jgi:hypothetical protein
VSVSFCRMRARALTSQCASRFSNEVSFSFSLRHKKKVQMPCGSFDSDAVARTQLCRPYMGLLHLTYYSGRRVYETP